MAFFRKIEDNDDAYIIASHPLVLLWAASTVSTIRVCSELIGCRPSASLILELGCFEFEFFKLRSSFLFVGWAIGTLPWYKLQISCVTYLYSRIPRRSMRKLATVWVIVFVFFVHNLIENDRSRTMFHWNFVILLFFNVAVRSFQIHLFISLF